MPKTNLPAGVVVSTRVIDAGADPQTADSTGNSGNITFEGKEITVFNGAALLAHGAASATAQLTGWPPNV